MSENIVKSTDINQPKEKKAPAKKIAKPKINAEVQDIPEVVLVKDYKLVLFESGASYNSEGYRFTQENRMQEVPVELADRLLQLDNFRVPNQYEIEEYLNSRRV